MDSVKQACTAYMYYSREQSSLVGEEMRREGKDSSIGNITSLVSERFKALSESERAPYDQMAHKDKDRYNRECQARDAAVLHQQEERRKQNSLTETETRMRGTTLQTTESSFLHRETAKRAPREMSASETKQRDERRETKKKEEAMIKGQHDTLKVERARQAEARLKYLLSQSDIFAHFQKGGSFAAGAAAGDAEDSKAAAAGISSHSSSASLISNPENKKSRHRSKRGGKQDQADDALDEDEAAMVAELDEDEEADDQGAGGSSSSGAKSKKKTTTLRVQPSIISGGAMREYQLEGLNWMIRLQENGINGILADEMGLGKTLQSISIIAYMNQFLGIKGPHLIMVPKSTLSNWMNEFKRFCPTIRVIRFHGNQKEREEIADEHLRAARTQESRKWDVCVTTYEVVNLEKNVLTKIAWRYLIIDEAHRLKNEESQFSQTVRMLQTQYRLLLTGTPLQNNLHELWALLNFLLPDVFSSSEQFDEWFDLDVDDVEHKQRIIGQLHKLLRPFMLRRLKADVEKSLLPKTETILFIGMSKEQKEIYKKVLMRDIDTINASNDRDSKAGRTAVLNIVMQLRKCCNHPYLFPGIEDRTLDPLGDHLYQSCGKMVLLHRLLRKLYDRDHRVLIFSQMTRMLDILEDFLLSQGYKYCRIDGNTSYDEREDRIQDFNAPGSEKFIFLLSTRAGGLGINLQTADTVILYDSDWNPQADLQAQDRAHRIGQKKAVQVFRLVTDETVEVKVVERAQQKLKLDAMVVQQGRLQEKEKKMTKQDLLETVRFGADKIFKSKDTGITDADIDIILDEGRKRTEEMNSKLQVAEKGDLFDFRLDGGMKTQEFDGIDYSDKTKREQQLAFNSLAFIDTGKRDRKMVSTYADNVQRKDKEGDDGRPKMPRSFRLPKMEDWQFYNRERLNELQEMENRIWDELVDKGELPQNTRDLQLLDAEFQEEKDRLLDEGFSSWTKPIFNSFVRASATHGRDEFDKIAKEMQLPVDEIKAYHAKFWTEGPVAFGDDWEVRKKQVEKGENKLKEILRLQYNTSELIRITKHPWDELVVRSSNMGNTARQYTPQEDRFLLCLTQLHGYGNWDMVRSSIRRAPAFRFDYYLQSCTSEQLGKRCEVLMRAAERELEQRRKAESGNVKKSPEEQAKEAYETAEKKRKEVTRQLVRVRDQLHQARIAQGYTGAAANSKNPMPTDMLGGSSSASAGGSSSATKDRKSSGSSGKSRVSKNGGFPTDMLPNLCRLVAQYPTTGIGKLIEMFQALYPASITSIPKNQIELTIKSIASKETGKWAIKADYAGYLDDNAIATPTGSAAAAAAAVATATAQGAAAAGGGSVKKGAKKARVEATVGAGAGAGAGADGKGKRKLADEAADGPSPPSKEKAPAKPRTAFNFFNTKEKKKEAEARAEAADPAASSEAKKEATKQFITQMFEELSEADKAGFEKQAEEDQKRFDNELVAYNARVQAQESQNQAAAAASAPPAAKKPRAPKKSTAPALTFVPIAGGAEAADADATVPMEDGGNGAP